MRSFRIRLDHEYSAEDHETLFQNLERANRDHYHLRDGVKTKINFLNVCALDFKNRSLWGHLGGPDDDKIGRRHLIDIKYGVTVDKNGKPTIEFDFSDWKTSYEQSIGLVERALSKMAKNSKALEEDHPFNGNLHGLYLFSAQKKGFHKDFDAVTNYAETNLILPPSFKESLVTIGYDLQWRESGA